MPWSKVIVFALAPARAWPYMLTAPKSTSTLWPARSRFALLVVPVLLVLLPMFRATRPMPVASRRTKVPAPELNWSVPPALLPVPRLTVVA